MSKTQTLLIAVAVSAYLLFPATCRAEDNWPCLWASEDMECQPADTLTAEQMDELQAHAEAVLRLAACRDEPNDPRCRVIEAPMRIARPEWAFYPMPWLRWSSSTGTGAFFEQVEMALDFALGRRANPFATDDAFDPFEVTP